MSWTLNQQFTYTSDPNYKNRIGLAFLKLANDITNEDPTTPDHVKRLALADQVISGSGVPPRCYQLLPILNPALQVTVNDPTADPTDNDIIFTVSEFWNYFADLL